MSAASRAAASGVVLGVVVVVLGQQFGYLDFTLLVPALEQIIIGAVIGGVIFGIIGLFIGRRIRRKMAKSASSQF